MDLQLVADELYGLTPAQFTPARDVHARRARDAGARELANAIAALHKPTKGAWLVNLLNRREQGDVAELLSVGASLRDAQRRLDGDDLRLLSARRRKVVTALVRRAKSIALGEGETVSDTVQREIEATLEAALADQRAADALRSGRLTRALEYAGIGEVDISGAVAGPVPQRQRQSPPPKDEPSRDAPGPREAEQRAADAERRLAAARKVEDERRVAAAREAEQEAADLLDEAVRDRDALAQRIREIEIGLEDLRTQAIAAGRGVDEAQRLHEAARLELLRAQEVLEQAGEHSDAHGDHW